MDYKKKIIQFLNKELNEKFNEIVLKSTPSKNVGDYAFPCFILARKLKKQPQTIAKDLEKLKLPKFIDKLESHGPYLNIFIKKDMILKQIFKEKQNFGKNTKKE